LTRQSDGRRGRTGIGREALESDADRVAAERPNDEGDRNVPSLTKLYGCPYCVRTGVGDAAGDVGRAVALAEADPGMNDGRVGAGDPEGVLGLNPHGPGNRPCPHVVSLLVDVEVGPRRPSRGRPPLAYTRTHDHTTNSVDPLGQEMSEHLWMEVFGGEEVAFHPATPFAILSPDETVAAGRRGWEVRISGTVFVAMTPDAFMTELRDTYVAQQEFWEREST
jgi:hypothetical protein